MQTKLLKAKGLYTFPNQFSELPEGALVQADNVNISRDSVIEPRRGLAEYGTALANPSDTVKQLLVYKGRVLRHYSTSFAFDSDNAGAFVDFNGSYTEVETGLRIKSVEANGNLLFTTNDGIKKISATTASEFTSAADYIRAAGAPPALDVKATVNYTTTGFFSTESKVAYRVVWGYKDVNGNLILGSASQRTEITNFSTTDTGTIDLTFSIPNDITTADTDYFYQIYRTAVFNKITTIADITTDDEMTLVIEEFPSSAQLTSRVVTTNDLTPSDIRDGGLPLYSNPVSGDGVLQSNDRPPMAKDVALFKDTVFYANTQTLQNVELDMLSVSTLVNGTSTLTLTDGTTVNTYTFVGDTEVTDLTFDTFANTVDGGYFLLNSASDERKYVFYADKTGTTPAPSAGDTAGRLIYAVNISAATTANDVAVAFASVIDALDDFSAPAPGAAVVTVTNAKNGNTTDAVDGATAMGGVFAINVTTQGDGEDSANLDVLLSSAATPSQQIDESARSLISIINSNSSEIVEAFYLSGSEDVPGQILLKAKELTTGEFYILSDSSTTSGQFNSQPAIELSGTVATGSGTVTITSTAHGLSNGNKIVLYSSTSTPTIDGTYTISNVTTNTFDISSTVTVGGNVTFGLTTVNSDNEVQANALFYSKYQEPEAVPSVNVLFVGPKDKEIFRIFALRETLFILKEDGIYRLSGEAGNFVIDLFDSSTNIVAPDSAVVLNNLIYVLSTQGIATISDTGVNVISRPIEDEIIKLISDNYNFKYTSFGVSYETDRAYLLWLPTNTNDTVATQCFRYDTFTNSWTRWPISKTCGIVNVQNNRLYVGAADEAYIERERKNYKRTDYADRQFALSIPANSLFNLQIDLSSNSNTVAGDVLVQTQYLTIFQFNQLLQKLDLDPFVGDTNYSATLAAVAGADLRNLVNNLATKLDADSGVVDTDYAASIVGTSTFAGQQSDFNIIVNKLNADAGVKFINYKLSSGTIDKEVKITSLVRNSTTRVNVKFNLPFIEGPIILYKAVQSSVTWAPYTFGDPSILKQVNESTIMFENTVFSDASVLFSSDLSPDFTEVTFIRDGVGDFGLFTWSEHNWGGKGSAVPMRTYVPRDKQRSRFIKKKFKHSSAREKYSIFGISFTFRMISEKAYRD